MTTSILHLIEASYLENFFFDLASYLVGVTMLIYTFSINNIKKKNRNIKYVFLISSLTPFFFNNVLFNWFYFPDQSKYLFITESIRNFNFYQIKDINITQKLTGILYALFPMPFINSFTALSLVSRFFFLITLFFFYNDNKKKILPLFFLICPSIIIYSSVALRETFLFSFLILFFLFLKKNKFLYAIFFILLLTLLKPEIGLVLIFSLAIYYFLFIKKNYINKIVLLLSVFFTLIFFSDFFLDLINNRYRGYFYEEFNFYPKVYYSLTNLIINLPIKFLEFIISPFLQLKNIFHFFQIFENLMIYIFLYLYFYNCYKTNKLITLFWFLILLFNLSIYSLIVVNAGSIARFKITLFVLIILSLNYSIKKNA
jgi:hypothetical protein